MMFKHLSSGQVETICEKVALSLLKTHVNGLNLMELPEEHLEIIPDVNQEILDLLGLPPDTAVYCNETFEVLSGYSREWATDVLFQSGLKPEDAIKKVLFILENDHPTIEEMKGDIDFSYGGAL